MMKEDLHQLHHRHPGMKIVISQINQRCRWRAELERAPKGKPGTKDQAGTRSTERGDEEQDRPGRWLDVAGGAADAKEDVDVVADAKEGGDVVADAKEDGDVVADADGDSDGDVEGKAEAPQEEDEGRDSGGYYKDEEAEGEPFESQPTSDSCHSMTSDFTADVELHKSDAPTEKGLSFF
ncbi:hypothetical protein F7725_020878 [Dissostichus mawsoni]|uniref:Uncharacterized protein n=1 Tax=Dissostichus mawsoni TaxID=36200 RepID=A0A7J5YEJ7_DISMA|nr:hypothetical protein F7725_020878 [Dissostichus mawsoni]